jgi:hypothetical protein
MRFAVQLCLWIVGFPLQLMVIAALVRGAYRQYLLLFVYTIAAFLIAVAEIPIVLAKFSGQADGKAFGDMYWADDVILQTLLYTVVINLIYKATARIQPRAVVRVILTVGALVFAAVSILIHYNADSARGEWMNLWTRDLSFCTTALDLALWTVLITTRNREPRVLLVSGALGIQFAGSAIGDAVQDLATRGYHSHFFNVGAARFVSVSGGIISSGTGFACLYFLWQAFRSKSNASPPEPAVLVEPTTKG